MALKKFTQIKGWDNLDNFFEKKVQGVHMVCENFDRVFCRCGETHASEGGIVHKCPKCGNTDFIEYGNTEYNYNIPAKIKYEADETYAPFTYTINKIKLSGEVVDDRVSVSFNIDTIPKYKFTKDSIEDVEPAPTTTPRYYYYTRDDDRGVPSELIEKWAYYKDNAELATEFYGSTSIDSLMNAMKIRKIFGAALEDDLFVQYPSLGKAVLRRYISNDTLFTAAVPGKNLEHYFNQIGLDKEFYSVYDYSERQNTNGYSGIFKTSYRRGYGSTSNEEWKDLQDKKKENSKGYQILRPYIMNGILDISQGCELCENINDMYSSEPELKFLDWNSPYKPNRGWGASSTPKKNFKASFPDEVLDLISVYIKENISVKKDANLCKSFVEDIDTLRDMKIAVMAENLKVKTMNYYLNRERLASTYKLPADKMEVFIDWFEKNPLKAIGLIENRRKLTKKQLDAFLTLMTED